MIQILTVEDDENSRLIVHDLLEDMGYEVIEALSGPDGVRAAEVHQPALILMDVQLPGFDGFEAIRRIQSNPSLQHIPIVVVTSYAMSADAARAREAGCGYVSKPFNTTLLLDTIRSYLR
jgi:two-component system cell cycle response regulator DivK